jgi:hypothetical protein
MPSEDRNAVRDDHRNLDTAADPQGGEDMQEWRVQLFDKGKAGALKRPAHHLGALADDDGNHRPRLS